MGDCGTTKDYEEMEYDGKNDSPVIFWDYGGVLVDFNSDLFFEKMAAIMRTGIMETVSFLTEGNPPLWHQFESDVGWTEEKTRRIMCERFNIDVAAEEFKTAFNSGVNHGDQKRLGALMEKIKAANLPQGVISNINYLHARRIESMNIPMLNCIPPWRRFYSFEIGLRKDETPKMFAYVFRRCGIKPEKAVFIDDFSKNIEGCERAGGKGILFRGVHRLEFELKRLRLIG